MAEAALELIDVTFRHKISSPKFLNPWNKRQGPGVFSLNLTLPKGEILGLVGPNGAGKTTLLRLLAGVIPLDSGTIRLNGDGLNESPEAIDYLLRCNVGHMPEQVRWNGSESVLETMMLFAEMREGDVDSKKLLDLVGLSSKLNDGLDTLSQGMRQRLSLAVSLMGSPKILLLDEPFNGLDPVAAKSVEKMVKQLAENGVSIIISSHHVAGMADFVDRLALIHKGQIVAEGKISEIEQDLGLSNRIEIAGEGEMPDFGKLLHKKSELISSTNTSKKWKAMVLQPDSKLMSRILHNGHIINFWQPKAPDIVEMLCNATGLKIEEIGMEIDPVSMLPLRNRGEEE
ncbi:MAG: ABC transporter ATP-binding protein [Euryarchaeota archaeon]|nr:ABC transporter ATP-binding protein [Euryarchaeota archaeon]